jgi:hypothetical protein
MYLGYVGLQNNLGDVSLVPHFEQVKLHFLFKFYEKERNVKMKLRSTSFKQPLQRRRLH